VNDPSVRQHHVVFARGRALATASLALALALIMVAGVGCASVKKDSKRIALENALSSYRQAIRWGYFPAAAGFLDPEIRNDVDTAALENVRVTGYEVIQPGLVGPDDVAVQLVQIDYVLTDRQRLRKLADRQRWRYDETSKAWWLASGLPDFSDATGRNQEP
jgi:hypothetical protein